MLFEQKIEKKNIWGCQMPVDNGFMDMIVRWADDPPKITTEAEEILNEYQNGLLKPSADQLANVLESLLAQQKFDAENRNLYRSALVIAQELWQPYFKKTLNQGQINEMMEELVHVIGGALNYRMTQSDRHINAEKELTVKEWFDTDIRDYIVPKE
jgi:hypothetical protein